MQNSHEKEEKENIVFPLNKGKLAICDPHKQKNLAPELLEFLGVAVDLE
jgi:hypothetical protein